MSEVGTEGARPRRRTWRPGGIMMAERPIELAKNRAYPLLQRLEAALAAGEIDEAGWYREVQAIITPAYLAEDTPWGQSGCGGGDDAARFAAARELIADAVD